MNFISQLNRFNKSRSIAQVFRIVIGTFLYLSISWVTLNVVLTIGTVLIVLFFTSVFVGFVFKEVESFKNHLSGEGEPHNLLFTITVVVFAVLGLYLSFGEYGAEVEGFMIRVPILVFGFFWPNYFNG